MGSHVLHNSLREVIKTEKTEPMLTFAFKSGKMLKSANYMRPSVPTLTLKRSFNVVRKCVGNGQLQEKLGMGQLSHNNPINGRIIGGLIYLQITTQNHCFSTWVSSDARNNDENSTKEDVYGTDKAVVFNYCIGVTTGNRLWYQKRSTVEDLEKLAKEARDKETREKEEREKEVKKRREEREKEEKVWKELQEKQERK